MSVSLSPNQILILWCIIAKGGEVWQKDVKPKISKPDRLSMEKAGLVKSARKRNSIWIEVTDAGWSWANEHLDSALSSRTQSAGPILQNWLTHLQRFMRRNGIALADIVSEIPTPEASGGMQTDQDVLFNKVRRAYLAASSGAWNKRVRLLDLRRILDGVPRSQLDCALLEMQSNAQLVLFGLDDKQEITPADRAAAIRIGGEPRHVLRMGG